MKAFRAVLIVVFGLVVLGFIVDDKPAQNAPEQQIERVKQVRQDPTKLATQIMSLTNKERAKRELGKLATSKTLNASACLKLDNMVKDDYWSHDNPNGTFWFSFITGAGYQYKEAGENLAYGYDTPQGFITGWLNSPKHKENMLKSDWTEQGLCVKDVYFQGQQSLLAVHHFAIPR